MVPTKTKEPLGILENLAAAIFKPIATAIALGSQGLAFNNATTTVEKFGIFVS